MIVDQDESESAKAMNGLKTSGRVSQKWQITTAPALCLIELKFYHSWEDSAKEDLWSTSKSLS
jgi:hypothetical protein